MEFLIKPLTYVFIQKGLIASFLIGITCATLGIYVVLRRMAFIGHALAHSALPGLVIAYLLGGNLFIGAMLATLVTAVGIGAISKDDSVYEDTAIGIMPTAMFAFGILLISATKSFRDLSAMLFGNILGITNADMIWIAGLTVAVITILFFFRKELELFSVDPLYAKSIGIKISLLRYTLLILLAMTVVVGIQAVGTILTNALLILPVATARLLTNRLRDAIAWACFFAVSSGVLGIYFSYYLNCSSGAAIIIVCFAFFLSVWLLRYFKKKIVNRNCL